MAGLSRKEQRELLDSLSKQGATLILRDKGVLVRFPDGSTTMIHKSVSDWRGVLNIRAEVRRAGFTWPWDGRKPKSAIPKGKNPAAPYATTIQRVERAIDAVKAANNGRAGFTISDIAEHGKFSQNNRATISRALDFLGYQPVTPAPGSLWFRPGEVDPAPTAAPAPLSEAPKVSSEGMREPVEQEPVERRPVEREPIEREFIDSVDSWTLDLDDPTVQAKTIGTILAEARRYGLKMEVRVWR